MISAPSLLAAAGSLIHLFGDDVNRQALARSWKSTTFCLVTPGLLFLLTFVSLAVHMYSILGKWPETIGNHGFSTALNIHGDVAFGFFNYFLLFTIFVWPVIVVATALFSRLKPYLPHVAAFGLSFWIFVPWIFLAPERLLYWWWD
jgi:hypothetical protein